MENHHFLMGKSTISMAIFNQFCSSLEGCVWAKVWSRDVAKLVVP